MFQSQEDLLRVYKKLCQRNHGILQAFYKRFHFNITCRTAPCFTWNQSCWLKVEVGHFKAHVTLHKIVKEWSRVWIVSIYEQMQLLIDKRNLQNLLGLGLWTSDCFQLHYCVDKEEVGTVKESFYKCLCLPWLNSTCFVKCRIHCKCTICIPIHELTV